MPVLYFSGINKPFQIELLAHLRAAGMLNALTAGQPRVLAACRRNPGVPLALDSAAYQGYTDVEAYARLIRRVGRSMDFCSNLDVLHNQARSDEHYQRLLSLLADEDDLRARLLWVYQSQSRGDAFSRQGDLEALRRALGALRPARVGVGGLVPVLERNIHEALDIIGAIGKVLSEAGAQGHFFGIGNYTVLASIWNERWFHSSDSSRWWQEALSRVLLTSDGRRLGAHTLSLSLPQRAEQNMSSVLAWTRPGALHQLALFPGEEEAADGPRHDHTPTARRRAARPGTRCDPLLSSTFTQEEKELERTNRHDDTTEHPTNSPAPFHFQE
ncbi:MAG: hypothetical protein ACREDR_00325 [Blastocatellia bacterium]